MVAFQFRMPSGIPGNVSRAAPDSTIESQITDVNFPPTQYGDPVKLVSGLLRPLATGDAANVIYGFLVRPFPTNDSQDPLGVSTPSPDRIANVLRRGYINTLLRQGTSAVNGQVFARVTTPTTPHPIGGVETAADGGTCVAVVGAFFTGAADANGNVEISFNI